MPRTWNIGSVTGATASDQARLHIGHHVENHVYLDETQLSPSERRRLREDAILSSLIFDRMTDRKRAVDNACESTFDWAFKDSLPREHWWTDEKPNMLRTWLSQEHGSFFVVGKAGSGKSTFMKYLTSHVRTHELLKCWARATDSSLLVASHFFWCSGSKIQSSQEGLWRSILFEVLKQHRKLISCMFCHLLEDGLLSLPYLRGRSWERSDLVNALSQLPHLLSGQKLVVCLFIDGLDEFEGDESMLVAEMKQLLVSPRIKICASSRPRNLFESAFCGKDNQWRLALHVHTRNDIAELVRTRLYGDQGFLLVIQSEKHRASFIDKIEERAEGVFLWAVLVVREINRETGRGGDMNDLEATLDMLPSDLTGSEGLFQRIIERSEPKHRKYMARFLLLMLYAQTRAECSTQSMYRHGAYFIFQKWNGTDSISQGCLRLEGKYREPWQNQHHSENTEQQSCCGIFMECHTGESGSHTNGTFCNVNMKLLWKDAQRQINRWCPDFVNTADTDIIQFSHRSVGDYLRIPEVQQNLACLAEEDFDPAPMFCYSWLAQSRLRESVTAGYSFVDTKYFLDLVLELDKTHREFARSSLRTFEQLHIADCTHPAHVPHGKCKRTPAYWAFRHCKFQWNDRYELVGGCTISMEQQYHAWFLAVLAVEGGSWYVEEEWRRIPTSARQDVGSIILAALIVTQPSRRASTDQLSDLVKNLLSSGVSLVSLYTWGYRRSPLRSLRPYEEDQPRSGCYMDHWVLDHWQVFIHMMPIVWEATESSWITWILDTLETLLDFDNTVQLSLPDKYKSVFSATRYVLRRNLNPHSELYQQWKTQGPRLQSILASRRLLTREERKLARKGLLIESIVDERYVIGRGGTSEVFKSNRERAGDWIRKITF